MKKALTRGEKWLFGAPLLFLVIAGVAWQSKKNEPYLMGLPQFEDVKAMGFSPDGKRLAAFFFDPQTQQRTGRVYDLESRSQSCELAAPPSVKPEAWRYYHWPSWSPDGKNIAAYSSGIYSNVDKIAIWDATSGAVKANRFFPAAKLDFGHAYIRYSPDGKTLIGQGVPPAIYDVATGRRLNKPDQIAGDNPNAKSSGNLSLIAMKDKLGRFLVIDSKTKRVLWSPKVKYLYGFRWCGQILCVNDNSPANMGKPVGENRLLLWDGQTRRPLPSPPIPPQADIHAFSLNPDLKTLAYLHRSAKYNPKRTRKLDSKVEVRVWDYRVNRVLWSYALESFTHIPVWSPDGNWLAMSNDETGSGLFVFDNTGQLRLREDNATRIICWSPDSRQLATVKLVAGFNGGRRIFNDYLEIHRF